MDVVEALPSDWSTDPFQFVEKDGYYYGRGTQDMKDSDAALVFTFLRLHREGYKPKRDLILALTADEEGGKFNGADWLVQQHRDLVDAAFVINPDCGGVELDHGRAVVADVEATEKVYSDFQITATNRGGHSSLPRPDNAIYELTTALNKLAGLHVSVRDERGHADLFQESGRSGDGPDGRGYARDSGHASRFGGGRAAWRRAQLQLQLSHHLRGHAAHRRPRQQCAAANRAGQCELQDFSRPLAGGDSPAVDWDLWRRQADSEVRLRFRRSPTPRRNAKPWCRPRRFPKSLAH